MTQHTHTHTDPEPGGWGQLVRHLRDDHGLDTPMFWSLADAHAIHQRAHPVPTDEETPMPDEQTHPEVRTCDAVNPEHDDLTCQYPVGHDPVTNPVSTDGYVYAGTFAHGDYRKNVWWIEPPTARVFTMPVREAPPGGEDEEVTLDELTGYVQDAVNRQAGNSQIREDRIICALAGVDFERYWVPDDAVTFRAALRAAYTRQARELLTAVDRGHLRDLLLPADEAAQGVLAQVNDRLEATQEALRASERMRNKAQAEAAQLRDRVSELDTQLSLLAGDLEKERQLVEDLEETSNQLRSERDRAIRAGEILERQRNEAVVRQSEAVEQWQRVVRQLTGIESERDAARRGEEAARLQRDRVRQVLRDGQDRLRQWAADIREVSKPDPDYIEIQASQVIRRIEEILVGQEQSGMQALTGVVQPPAVDDHAPRIDAEGRSLTLELPIGTARVMLTFVPENVEDTDRG